MRREYNVLALMKGNERYVYVYDDGSRDELIAAFRNQAADPHLSLNWFDAGVLTERAREQAPVGAPAEPPAPRVMHRIATPARIGFIGAPEQTRPVTAVSTTRDMTLGLRSCT